MQVQQNGSTYNFSLEGPISEKCPLYDYVITGAKEVIIDMKKVTFINSIGVKNWILWTLKVPESCKLELINCPFVIINQVNMVQGFLPKHARIQSFLAPYISESGAEMNHLCQRGQEYQYAENNQPPQVNFPKSLKNEKGQTCEPDFVEAKITKFLTPT